MKKNKLTMIAALLAAILVIAGCSPGTPASLDKALPKWLANSTLTGDVTVTQNGEQSSSTERITTTANDIDSWKSWCITHGVSCFENGNDSDRSYTLEMDGLTLVHLIEKGIPGMEEEFGPMIEELGEMLKSSFTLRMTFTNISDSEVGFESTMDGTITVTELGISKHTSMKETGTLSK